MTRSTTLSNVRKPGEKRGVVGWGDAKKVEVVTTYLALGKIVLVAAICKVPENTLRQWKMQPWWPELIHQIQTESDQELDTKLQKRIDKALDVVMDRLENGDFQFNQRTGEISRMPVKMRDASKVATELFDKRTLIRRNMNKPQINQEAVADVLSKLAKEFADFANYKKTKVIEVEIIDDEKTQLPFGVRQVPGETVSDQESVQPE